MGDQKRPLRPGEHAPAFALPSANQDGTVSLDSLRGHPFLIAFFRGLHCPFCRRQVGQLGRLQPALSAAGVETVAVMNTPVERARIYFEHRPSPAMLLCDQECSTHRAFGVPYGEFLPEGSREKPVWPYQASMEQFEAARINPTGELPEALHPMAANVILNARDGFELTDVDHAVFDSHPTQLVGHFLIDGDGIVRWVQIEARDGPDGLCIFPNAAEILEAANSLQR